MFHRICGTNNYVAVSPCYAYSNTVVSAPLNRHSRAGGNPRGKSLKFVLMLSIRKHSALRAMDSRLRGNDDGLTYKLCNGFLEEKSSQT